MRHIREIPLSQVDVDRLPINPSVMPLVKHLEAGGTVPPIHVRVGEIGGRFAVLDGRHRILAHRLLGRSQILARWGD